MAHILRGQVGGGGVRWSMIQGFSQVLHGPGELGVGSGGPVV